MKIFFRKCVMHAHVLYQNSGARHLVTLLCFKI